MRPARQVEADVNMEDKEVAVLAKADPRRRYDLASENAPDELEGEQTWPTEEELAQAASEAGKVTIRLLYTLTSYL